MTIRDDLHHGKRTGVVASIILIASIVASPTAVTSLLIYASYNSTILDSIPAGATWNDEVYYWHQAYTFSTVGFSGGYYTYEEIPPRSAQWVRFAAWGPVYPVLFGALGNLLGGGWKPYTGIFINLGAVTLALAVFIFLVRPDIRQLVALQLFLLVWWPLWFFLPYTGSYAFVFGISIVAAALFYRLTRLPNTPSATIRWLALALILGASTLRPQFAVLAFPLFLLTSRNHSGRSVLTAVLKGVGVVGFAAAFTLMFYSPFPYFGIARMLLGNADVSALTAVHSILSNIVSNTVDLIRVHLLSPSPYFSGFVWWKVSLTGQLVASLLVAAAAGLVVWRRVRISNSPESCQTGVELLFHVFNLASILGIVTTVYTASLPVHYMPPLLLSYLLLIACKRWRAITAVIACNLAFMCLSPGTFYEWRTANFKYDSQALGLARDALKDVMRYQPGVDPWCNTLLSAAAPFTYAEMISVPPGIGYSVHMNSPVTTPRRVPFRSRYILYVAGEAPPPEWGSLTLLKTSTVGDLYLNLNSACQKISFGDPLRIPAG